MAQHDEKPRTTFSPAVTQFLDTVGQKPYSVLCGRNNCGKSYLLKLLASRIGEKASYLGPARYQNFNVLSPYAPTRNRRAEKFRAWMQQWQQSTQNLDNSPFNLQQAIAELSNIKRAELIEIMDKLLGSTMETPYTIPDNSMSQQYVSVNGYNISYASSGYRLITSLVTSLLSDEHDTYLIDEPELGISPEAQGTFSDFLFDPALRNKYFPHVRSLVFATHSTLFLDRRVVSNNYFVTKTAELIDIEQVSSVADINRVHFFLLGNRLEALYMPSAIIIVEGKTDVAYIERVLRVRYPAVRFSLIAANSDSRIRDVFNVTKNLFGDIQKSPYSHRVFAIVDSTHGTGMIQHLEGMGMPRQNIVVWEKNGIEYYYPQNLIQEVFHSTEPISVHGDRISLNGLTYTKQQLSDLILPRIDGRTVYPAEFSCEFLNKLECAIDQPGITQA